MREINMDLFYEEMMKVVDVLEGKEMDNICKASEVCAETIAQGGVVHVFGSGHSVGFGMELAGRPGSLVPFHTIVTSDFVLHGKVSLAEFKDPDNIFERRADIADRLYDLYDIRPQDSFIIISNSGINGCLFYTSWRSSWAKCFLRFLRISSRSPSSARFPAARRWRFSSIS